MKEFKLEDVSPVLAVESKIWSTFDLLRGEVALDSSRDFHVVLFLLALHRDGLLNHFRGLAKEEWLENLQAAIKESDDQIRAQYDVVLLHFVNALHKLSEHGWQEFAYRISSLDRNILTEHFDELFDEVLYKVALSNGKFGGGYLQPIELTRLMVDLADLPKEASIFNPFAGVASFGVMFENGQTYFGQEISPDNWAIGALRIAAHNRLGKSYFTCADSISYWPKDGNKHDLVIATPPFGMKYSPSFGGSRSDFHSIEQFLLEEGLDSTNEKGKVIALLPQSWLFKGEKGDSALRQHLVDEDLIDTIIGLPGGMMSYTGIPSVVVVLNKAKTHPKKVRFVKAEKFVEAKGKGRKVLNNYTLNAYLHGERTDENVLRWVDISEIQDENYNLSTARYFQQPIVAEGSDILTSLKELLAPVSLRKAVIPDVGKYIRIRDLKSDELKFNLRLNDIEETLLPKAGTQVLAQSALLVALTWRELKPTWFTYHGEIAYVSKDIFALSINTSKVDLAYLINELHASYVNEQLEALRTGGTIPTLKKSDFLDITIKLPSLLEQKARIAGKQELAEKIDYVQESKNEFYAIESKQKFDEFASLKHTLGRPRQNILDWTDNILHFFLTKKAALEMLDKDFKDYYGVELEAALREIKRDINFITEVLEKGERGFANYELEPISLKRVNEIIKELSNNGFDFQIHRVLLDSTRLLERGIIANATMLNALLGNVLTNANKHAFDKAERGNTVIIELKEVDEKLLVEIRNNGKPFPKNFDKEKFIAKFSTANAQTGSGLGGYDIHRIATKFGNPDWDLILNQDPLFPVKLQFSFPIKPIL